MIGAFAGLPAIGFGLGLATACRKKVLFKRAYRMATSSNLELPPRLVDHVLRFLRRQYVTCFIASWVTVILINVLFSVFSPGHGPRFWARWLPWLIIVVPVLSIVFSFLMSAWPRWRASGAPRITHAKTLSPNDAFTRTEYAVVVLGWILSSLASAWLLRHFHAATGTWFVWAGSMCLSLVVWWGSAMTTMNRPTSASDAVELSWDDMLRFSAVRGLSVAASWGSAMIILFTDWMVVEARASQEPGWPLYVPVIAVVMVALVFQQGRQLWRTAWA
jgi:hypothetical protein